MSSVPLSSSDDLATALTAYQKTFGHSVPADVVRIYIARSGPLVLEIRQAIALGTPVRAWLARSRQQELSPLRDDEFT
jgi:hypothetical protein